MTLALDPFNAAVEAANAELGAGTPDETAEAIPAEGTEVEAADDQVSADGNEQVEDGGLPETEVTEDAPAEAEEAEEELFGDLEVEEPAPTEDEGPKLYQVPGMDEPVDEGELINGYLRQSDYTRKTQELASQRKDMDTALQLYQALQERPHDLARQLAEAAGFIEPGAVPTKVVDLPIRTDEEVQAEIDRKVEEALTAHPLFAEAQRIVGQQWIESEFGRIEQEYGVKLGTDSRNKVLREAQKRQTDDLELVFTKMLAQVQGRQSQVADLKRAAPKRPAGPASSEPNTKEAESFEEAFEMAMAEVNSRSR